MLRNYNAPAETLTRRRDEKLYMDVFYTGLTGLVFLLMLTVHWTYYLFPRTESITFATVLYVAIASMYFLKAYRNYKKVKRMTIGITAERDAGHFLEQELPKGYRVINSINKGLYDIDHVIIGPSGVYCIETKNTTYQDKHLTQARGNALQVSGHLKISNNIDHFVTPVVLLPRRHVESVFMQDGIVCNLTQFKNYLESKTESVLSDKQIKLFRDVISLMNS